MADTGSLQHYRLSLLGQDLGETLEELINNEMFEETHRELVMEHFEKSMKDVLSKEVKSKTVIKGQIDHYRNHDDIWTFFLKYLEMNQGGKVVSTKGKTQMIAVAKK